MSLLQNYCKSLLKEENEFDFYENEPKGDTRLYEEFHVKTHWDTEAKRSTEISYLITWVYSQLQAFFMWKECSIKLV